MWFEENVYNINNKVNILREKYEICSLILSRKQNQAAKFDCELKQIENMTVKKNYILGIKYLPK